MIDSTVISVRAGDGGDGAVSFRHEKFAPQGGPDGGEGGHGGDVVLVGDSSVNTLEKFQYRARYAADGGGAGGGRKRRGKDAEDLVIRAPVGTEVWVDEEGLSVLAGELAEDGQALVVARGGRGGRGNTRYVSPSNQEPLLAEAGAQGEERVLRLELKLLADVGIVGMPNAGKSSLLTALTSARPRIAEYPFTTLEPALGVLSHRFAGLVMVEIPGLIEGASDGVGLGHEFLRHVERTRLLVHLIDGSESDVARRRDMINDELRSFDPALAEKRQIIVVNKIDLPDVAERRSEIRRFLAGPAYDETQVLFVSAATHEGLETLREALFGELAGVRAADDPERSDAQTEVRVIKPKARGAGPLVVRDGETLRVVHRRAVRVARGSDLELYEAQIQFHHLLERLGVVQALVDQGVETGDTVFVGETELEWS